MILILDVAVVKTTKRGKILGSKKNGHMHTLSDGWR
jgi:hypothetical protein